MSSSEQVIEAHGVSKAFRIYGKPTDRLRQILRPGKSTNFHREFWALKDVSFEVKKGQTVGIIGQNGSGKSTLLQIIAGTMAATEGTVHTQGKIAALLELGSGFNPEFTGRENVYLNGSLLGLSREQIDDKFDYIAGFADIGEFLDQPVKTYSSGMMLRLAFAVQVAVDSDVMIIDEALAVGDARFQLKCFKRLEELKRNGTSILFVSHATELVRSFCDYGLLLERGKVLYWGDAKTATLQYLASIFPEEHALPAAEPKEVPSTPEPVAETETPVAEPVQAAQNPHETTVDAEGTLRILPQREGLHVFGAGGANIDWLEIHGLQSPNILPGGKEIRVRCQFTWDLAVTKKLVEEGYERNITVGIALATPKGNYLFGCNGFDSGVTIDPLQDGTRIVEFTVTLPELIEGDYFLVANVPVGNQQSHVQLIWYDALVQLRYMSGDRTIYGMVRVDYDMRTIDKV